MPDILQSLQAISTGYSVFEKNQVLTHDQLNSIASYFDDQTRLTRVKLLGIGIVCGLRVALAANSRVTVTKGVGITTDGDLLYYNADTVFDRFKSYDKSHPAYRPFFTKDASDENNEMVPPLYELVREAPVEDPLAVPLTQFNPETALNLADMVAVLFMESYVNDPDICSGTDCDNLGQEYISTIKLLLVHKASVGLLKKAMATPAVSRPEGAFGKLGELVADRPIITPAVTSSSQLFDIYRAASNNIHAKLVAELPKYHPHCSFLLGEPFSSDPAGLWIEKLKEINLLFATNGFGIQYYYDFLKDLIETWNAFRDALFVDDAGCCPDLAAFPKHLLLGDLAGTHPDENRTGFHPSPLAGRTAGQLGHATFLVKKLDALIQDFKIPDSSRAAIRITPSLFEDRPLEERAVPYYYPVPSHKTWSYRLNQRGMDTCNYSYHAGAYGAQGGAAAPLTSQIGRFSFFRIEGHFGQNVSTVLAAIENEIQSKNLPFVVRSVMLRAEIAGVDTPKPILTGELLTTSPEKFEIALSNQIQGILFNQFGFSPIAKPNPRIAVVDPVAQRPVEPRSVDQPSNVEILFSHFFSLNPGMEHFAGVVRGGTFVLVYDGHDENQPVVADFMLPCYCCETIKEPAEVSVAINPKAVELTTTGQVSVAIRPKAVELTTTGQVSVAIRPKTVNVLQTESSKP